MGRELPWMGKCGIGGEHWMKLDILWQGQGWKIPVTLGTYLLCGPRPHPLPQAAKHGVGGRVVMRVWSTSLLVRRRTTTGASHEVFSSSSSLSRLLPTWVPSVASESNFARTFKGQAP